MELIPLPGPSARDGALLDETLNKGPLLLPGGWIAAEGCEVGCLLVHGLPNERRFRHPEIVRQPLQELRMVGIKIDLFSHFVGHDSAFL
jgi:hypothetical protein